ncbi:transposase [Okeania hirsuta]|uniref:transposase n=3 Tax=Okeania hirsuta TaxID=1458930 RepID=UPI001F03185F|nr:transposase [Okeania hirsuta]
MVESTGSGLTLCCKLHARPASSFRIEATTQKITISRQAGDWYLSLAFDQRATPTPKTTDVVGVDLGVKTLATLSTGQVFPSIKPYRTAQDQLAKLQRQLSRKVKDSKNWHKAVIKLAIAAQTSS